MNQSHSNDPSQTPIQDFSACHVGILSKLDLLAELPALLGPAARARDIATQALDFFRDAVFEHHLDEERELFPAVLDRATPGEERERARAMVKRLTDEHRVLESLWKHLEPLLKKVAKGHPVEISVTDIQGLVARYRDHAQFEETAFLPLAQQVLGRDSFGLAALGLSLHLRHAVSPLQGYI